MDAVGRSLPPGYCRRAAEALAACPRRTVFITTGFPVAGTYETDGPVAAVGLYGVLERLGFTPQFVAAPPIADALAERYRVIVFPITDEAESKRLARRVLDEHRPVALIAIERPGEAADGRYYNMRHEDITDRVARLGPLFRLAACPTIGIGDGGNEIGMGNALAALAGLEIRPCVVRTTHLVVATTSNWGVYGLIAALQQVTGQDLLSTIDEHAVFDYFLSRQAVDGRTLRADKTVDGHEVERTAEILAALQRAVSTGAR
jgi:hypothetical protein